MRRYLVSENDISSQTKKYDIVIVGAGLAGLYCALNISSSFSCALITKGGFDSGSSWLAQGGIAAVTREDDSFENHISDTLSAGAGHCDKEAVRVLVEEGPEDIRKMIEYGVPFDKNENGEIRVTREGGHGCSRILHCGGDATGRLMTQRLAEVVSEKENIDVIFDTSLVDVLTDENGAYGIVVNDGRENYIIESANIVIASGSIGQLYRYTTNPKGSNGEGIAACMRAGAKTRDMEFVQFHPTALAIGERDGRMFLVSEAVRGEGGILKNSSDEPFMYNKHSLRDLAPRDIVTREILKELDRTDTDTAYLDVSCMDEEFFSKRFPTIYGYCKECGINVPHDKIPVRPTQHYHMGGIETDLDARTNIEGLYACGECACTGVQGANRLASNSTLECLVFGRRAANYINTHFRKNEKICPLTKSGSKNLADCPETGEIEEDIMLMKKTMSKYVGPVRKKEGLEKALCVFGEMKDKYEKCVLSSQTAYTAYAAACVSAHITEKALSRKESIGSHYIVK